MPIYEYKCSRCGDVQIYNLPINHCSYAISCVQDGCGSACDKIPSVPASIPVGKYGKGGGK